ncbi:PIN domain-containing protein [Oceanisphaera ostreae]|uniref:PIN domain-containing protein n=1 Tax=Oceanisphaera ostreae TaxID=914151 RepID=A0ABW3KJ44_9GAMM
MKWAFIDYENVGCLSKIDLSTYSKIILFLGAMQPKIDLGETKYDSPIELVLIQLKATQANNLDFHLSYYLGKFDSEVPSNITFEIISNDQGFSPLIEHIKTSGRACKQVKVTTTLSTKSKLISSLTSKPKDKRPKKVASLRNHIAASMGVKGNDLAIQNYFNQLINEKIIKVSGDSVEYKS